MTRVLNAVLVAVLTVGWVGAATAQESTLEVVKKRGTLVAGVKADYPRTRTGSSSASTSRS
jgi:hypothetical protein